MSCHWQQEEVQSCRLPGTGKNWKHLVNFIYFLLMACVMSPRSPSVSPQRALWSASLGSPSSPLFDPVVVSLVLCLQLLVSPRLPSLLSSSLRLAVSFSSRSNAGVFGFSPGFASNPLCRVIQNLPHPEGLSLPICTLGLCL